MNNRKHNQCMFIDTVRDAMNSDPELTVEKYAKKFMITSKKEICSLLKIATNNDLEEYHRLLGRSKKNKNKNMTGNNVRNEKTEEEYQKYIDYIKNTTEDTEASIAMAEDILKGYRED